MKRILFLMTLAMAYICPINADIRSICADAHKNTNFNFSAIFSTLSAAKNNLKNAFQKGRFFPGSTHSYANPFVRMASTFASQKLNKMHYNSAQTKSINSNLYSIQNTQILAENSKKDSGIKSITLQNDRPSEVQAAINKAFKQNKNASKQSWLFKGDWGFYGLLNLDEKIMINRLVSENREKKDIYIIDVGCAQGGWGRDAMQTLLQNDAYKKSGKRFHILSITGGQECDELVQHKDNVTLYQFNQFKIENIDEELSKRGFDIKDKVDLIVSRWTLRHLVDPFGTLKRMYDLLTPAQGKLMSNGFLFMFNDSDKVKAFPDGNENILTYTNATPLFRDLDVCRDTGEFLLVRNDKSELKIPLEYTGRICPLVGNWQNDSRVVTVYNKGSLNKPKFELEYIKDSPWRHYCDKDDQQCKNLYAYLLQQGLFYQDKSE